MIEVVDTNINSFAHNPQQSDSVPREEQLVEFPVSDLQLVLNDLVSIYNGLVDTIRSCGIVKRHELGKTIEQNTNGLKAEKDPIGKIILLNAYIKQLNNKIRGALKSRPNDSGRQIKVTTKIRARAIQIIDYVRIIVADDPKRKQVSLDSAQCRMLFSGKYGEQVSRRDTIRAMAMAKRFWPDLRLEHRPNDGRSTMRLIGETKDLTLPPEFEYKDTKCDSWQRSAHQDLMVMFNFV
ncbi:MAG: hypothetical protein WB392_03730 [Methanotrichaceae archaeon]